MTITDLHSRGIGDTNAWMTKTLWTMQSYRLMFCIQMCDKFKQTYIFSNAYNPLPRFTNSLHFISMLKHVLPTFYSEANYFVMRLGLR